MVLESYQYNEKGQLVEHAMGDLLALLHYNSSGHLIRIVYSNSTTSAQGEHTLTYSNSGRSVLIKDTQPLYPALAQEHSAEFDEKGQLLSYSTRDIQTGKASAKLYAYDQVGKLLKAPHGGSTRTACGLGEL